MKLHNIRKSYTINAQQHKLILGNKTCVMGILNLTSDSFSQDGQLQKSLNPEHHLRVARRMVKAGADIIDVGGESTRPGAMRVSIKEELDRVIPTISLLVSKLKCPISIDTYKARVAKEALNAGACIVNNIMGTDPDPKILQYVKEYDAAYILMHIRGTPKTMQNYIHYSDLIGEITRELQKSVQNCLDFGIKKDRIIIDPGIGFCKTVDHNLQIIQNLPAFKSLNVPILMGTSRKSFIGKTLDLDVTQRLIGTMATVSASVLGGAHIVRAHDVKETVQTIQMMDAIINSK